MHWIRLKGSLWKLKVGIASCIELRATGALGEAFYVNKHAEQIRGKLRLVTNYQDLNHFLADDKFPLPNKSALFQHLQMQKYFQSLILKQDFGS